MIMAESTQATNRTPLRGTEIGVVTSDARDQTRKVTVNYLAKHTKYGKYVRRRSVFQVHDPKNESHLGDTVEIANCRPISKTKNWRLVKVIEAAPTPIEHRNEPETEEIVAPVTETEAEETQA